MEKHKSISDHEQQANQKVTKLDSLVASVKQAEKERALLKERIEALLPGATSIGLSTAFEERKKSFKNPKETWRNIFFVSLVGLFCVPTYSFITDGLPTDAEFPSSAEGLLVYFMLRLPFTLPFVWLAIYASLRHGQALRLDEEYAHKEALSKSFEGYKKQIYELEGSEQQKNQTLNLIATVVRAIGRNPSMVYKDKPETNTPGEVVLERSRKMFDPHRSSG